MIPSRNALLALMLASCSRVPDDKFGDKIAEAICPQLEECLFGEYELQYRADEDRCQTGEAKLWDDIVFVQNSDGCTFDEKLAKECVSRIDDMECDGFFLAYEEGFATQCSGVWSCPE
jgi:hypothetical protein